MWFECISTLSDKQFLEPGPIHQYAQYVLFSNAIMPTHPTGANTRTDLTKDISI